MRNVNGRERPGRGGAAGFAAGHRRTPYGFYWGGAEEYFGFGGRDDFMIGGYVGGSLDGSASGFGCLCQVAERSPGHGTAALVRLLRRPGLGKNMCMVWSMKREQFTFYRSFYEAVKRLPKRKRMAFVMAIVEYGLDHVEPTGLDDTQYGFFLLTKPVLDSAWRKAKSGAIGGKTSVRGPAKKISKGEIEKEVEIEVEKEIEKEIETHAENEGFAAFWGRYPVQMGREAAEAEWMRVRDKEDFILSSLEDWKNCRQWQEDCGRFIPRADKWLRERWWEQKPAGVIPKGASGVLGKAELEAINRLFDEGGTQ